MENATFEDLKMDFADADTETKIEMYVQAEDLTQEQYKELLRMFPMKDLHKLELALA